jgi:hypothetical protein
MVLGGVGQKWQKTEINNINYNLTIKLSVMKQLNIFTASFLALLLFTFSQCKKKTEELQLPPETTTGAMTFGCKVNGKVFVPKDGRGQPGLFVQYVNLGAVVGGGWFLNIPATNWVPSTPEGVNIGTDSLLISEGSTYEFKLSTTNQRIKGSFNTFCDFNGKTYAKTASDIGSIYIRKFDQINRILSGTFFYSATNISTGEKITITEGRFDIRY